jgi:hypothetical protein
MAHQRSPNCPQITFAEAAAKGRLVYEKEHTHPAAKEVVAQSLGYSGMNGRSLTLIAALRSYGILEGTGEAMRVSDDAVTYFEADAGEERTAALSRMLFHPPFFEQIRSEFGATLPSESNLKHYLIKQGFLPKAAEDVIRVYRENILLVENTPKRYIEKSEGGGGKMGMAAYASATTQPTSDGTGIGTPIWSQSYVFPLSKGTTVGIQIKGDVTKQELGKLKAMVDLMILALENEVVEPPVALKSQHGEISKEVVERPREGTAAARIDDAD